MRLRKTQGLAVLLWMACACVARPPTGAWHEVCHGQVLWSGCCHADGHCEITFRNDRPVAVYVYWVPSNALVYYDYKQDHTHTLVDWLPPEGVATDSWTSTSPLLTSFPSPLSTWRMIATQCEPVPPAQTRPQN